MLKLRKGFTLIELLIVVVIIGIFGRDRDPEVREHEVEGVHHRDEVGSSQTWSPRKEAYFADSSKYTQDDR